MKIKGYLKFIRSIKKEHPDLTTKVIYDIMDKTLDFRKGLEKK